MLSAEARLRAEMGFPGQRADKSGTNRLFAIRAEEVNQLAGAKTLS
jgi:hypothetical protein